MSEKKKRNPIEILLVEDDALDATMTKRYLKEAPASTHLNVVRDGEEALDFLFQRGQHTHAPRPDVILLDMNLPKVDGRQVLEEIKKDTNLNHIPLMVVSGDSVAEDLKKKYGLDDDCFVNKWLDMKSFTKLIKSVENYRAER